MDTPERILVFALGLILAAVVAVTAANFIADSFAKATAAFEQVQPEERGR